MEQQKLCMNCMQPLAPNDTACPHCKYAVGRQNPEGYLPTETILQEHYLVGRALGSYGDACIYMGYDTLLKNPVYIREFFPADFCERQDAQTVAPTADKQAVFDEYRNSFYANVRTLAKLKDLPCILPLYDIFDQNGTAYAVYDYCEGQSLSRTLKARGGRMPWAELRPLFMQLLTTVSALHRAGIYHLAIGPDTILMGADGKLRLRSFAIPEARISGTAIKPRLFAGFAAPEQYTAGATCDAATDVYGLAATLFAALTGNVPPEAPRRVRGSQDLFLPADVAEELPEEVGLALFNALQTDRTKRLQTVEELRSALSAEPAVNALLEDAEQEMAGDKPTEKKNRYPLYIGISVFVVLAVLATILLCLLFPQDNDTPDTLSDEPVVTTTLPEKTTTSYVDPESIYSIPNLMGKNYYAEKHATMTGEFKLEISYMKYDAAKAKGTILSQEPAAGQSSKAGETIKVVISMGSEDLKVPDVAGWPEEYATKYLEALGFKVDVLPVNVSEYEKGLVEGTDPATDTKMGVGDTVTLRVSNVEPATDQSEDAANAD